MYQSLRNVRRGKNLSRQVLKAENRNKQNLNSRIFRKKVLRNLKKMIHIKYQCNRNARSMLKPKFAQCEARSKNQKNLNSKSRQIFNVEKQNKKKIKIQDFQKNKKS